MSNPRIALFFSVFGKSVQDEIMDFCRRLTASHSDIYIAMARKAAVLCDCLEELGLIHLDGYVTSDRVLDINGDWLEGKNITIIDDAVVSGTTLYSTIQKIKLSGAKNISVQVLTVNEKWFCAELLQDDAGKNYMIPIYNRLPDSSCIKLCNDLVSAISLVPRPYDVDFPLYRTINITEYELQRILVLNNWETYDVSTALQREHNVLNFTLLPNYYELCQITKLFGIDVTKDCIIKIRVYSRLISAAKKQYALRISPFFIFEEMHVDTVQKIFDTIVSDHYKVDTTLFENWSSTAQLRFLHFYYSHQLARFWNYRINHLLIKPFELTFSYRNLSFLFPQQYATAVEELCKRVEFPQDIIPIKEEQLRCHNAETVYAEIDPISLNARLYEPFLEIYHTKELPCRELVLQYGSKVFFDDQYKELRNRLNKGLSFQDMVRRLSDCTQYYDIKKKVSLFIDRSVDAGIIVPIIQQEGNIVFRAYRHGEDVLFGCREELMYNKMLSLFAEYASPSVTITKMRVEKMIVLFSKIGLREKILYPYTSNFTAEPLDKDGLPLKILRVKTHIKGPVALLASAVQHQRYKNIPFITGERKAMWMTNVLIQNGKLCVSSNGRGYDIKETDSKADFTLLTETELTFVQNFAELAGRISNPNIETGVTFDDTDWAKVSVTLTLPDTITAVAAEMEIFSNDFSFADIIGSTGNQEIDAKRIQLFCRSFAFESIHSSEMKINSFIGKSGQKLIQAVHFPSNIEQRIWLSYFTEELNNDSEHNNAILNQIFYEQQVWTRLVIVFVNALFIRAVKRYAGLYNQLPCSKDQYDRACKRMSLAHSILGELRKQLSQYELDIQKQFDDDRSDIQIHDASKLFNIYDPLYAQYIEKGMNYSNIDTFFQAIGHGIEQIEDIASNIKEMVCDVLGERGKVNEIIRFNNVLHINLSACTQEKFTLASAHIEQIFRSEQTKVESDRQYYVSKGHPSPPFELRELPQKYKPESPYEGNSQDMWFIGYGHQIGSLMANFSRRIFYRLYQNGIDCQITYFERLSYDTCIKSNSSEFAEYHCNQFNTFIEQFKKDILFPEKIQFPCIRQICTNQILEKTMLKPLLEKDKRFSKENTYIKQSTVSKQEYQVTEYVCIEKRIDMKPESAKAFDFGIITILPEETDAVCQVLSLHRCPSKFGKRTYYIGEIDPQDVENVRHVICTQAIDQGESSVISAYNDMMNQYQPKFVFLIGIAGSILDSQKEKKALPGERRELDLCDVVIAKSVIDYELRKETANGIEQRGRMYNVSAESAAIINDFLVTLESHPLTAIEGSKNANLHVLFDPIGSGNAVIGNELSKIVTWLKEVNSKVVAVEMEAAGISSAFYEKGLSEHNVKGLLVVRGISDMANVDKDFSKPFRKPAAQNAALVAKTLMEFFPEFD